MRDPFHRRRPAPDGFDLPSQAECARFALSGSPVAPRFDFDAELWSADLDTVQIGQVVQKYSMRDKGLKVAGGFDLVPETLAAINGGSLDFTIDQQPYLQGFLPVLYLYLYKLSGGLMFPSETNTGLLFVTKDNVTQYQNTQTRYEGSATDVKLVERSGPIAHG